MANRPSKHLPVHAYMFGGCGLAQHMGPFQMPEGGFGICTDIHQAGGIQLSLDAGTDAMGESGHNVIPWEVGSRWGVFFRTALDLA